jgi:hypothetical protein
MLDPVNPSILAAIVAYLRSIPSIVAAFGDAPPAEPHFWSDYGGPVVPALPYAVFAEPTDHEGFETIDNNAEIWSIADGIVTCQVFAASKTQARSLADRLASALNDAPLAFVGIATAGVGTVAATNGSPNLAFSQAQSGLDALYLALDGDTSAGPDSGGLYLVTGGSSASWTIAPPFAGATLAAAAWTSAQQAGLIYFRRTNRAFTVVSDIGPDGRPTVYARIVQFRSQYEQMDEVITS